MTNHKMTTVLFCKEMMTLKFMEFQVENYDSDEDNLELQSDSESEDNVKKESSLEDSILHQSHLHSVGCTYSYPASLLVGTDIGGQQTPLYLTTSLSSSSTTLCHQGGVTDVKTRQNTDDGEDSNKESWVLH